MAIDLMDEHEQGERVRAWLRDNGSAIIGGIAIGVAGLVGWQWWGSAKVEHRLDAAVQFQALQDAVERKDRDTIDSLTASLGSKFSDTGYAAFAALTQATQMIDAGETDGAIASLKRAVELAPDPAVAGLAQVRLARLQIGSGQAEAAVDTLKKVADDTYEGLVAELRGDALLALERPDEARTAYKDAIEALETGAPARRVVEMKLVDLGGELPVPDAQES